MSRRGPLRVLMVTDSYAPYVGGLEIAVGVLARALAERGHSVAIATLSHPDAPAFEDEGGVRVHRFAGWTRRLGVERDPAHAFHPPAPDPGVVRRLRAVIAEERPDVIHGHGWMAYSALVLPRSQRPPVVITLHDYGFVCPKKTYLRHGHVCEGPGLFKCIGSAAEQYGPARGLAATAGLWSSRPLNHRVRRFIAISDAVAEAGVLGGGVPVEVIPTYVDDSILETAADAPRPEFLADDGYVLFAGALGRQKGIDVLLEAYARHPPGVPLVLLGGQSPDTPNSLPPGVSAYGAVPHDEVLGAMAHATVVVVPSVWAEPYGMVAVEAMAASRPVVASAVGGLTDIVIDGETGVLVPPADADALGAAIVALVADPARCSALGTAGRARSRSLTVSNVVERIIGVYEEVASDP